MLSIKADERSNGLAINKEEIFGDLPTKHTVYTSMFDQIYLVLAWVYFWFCIFFKTIAKTKTVQNAIILCHSMVFFAFEFVLVLLKRNGGKKWGEWENFLLAEGKTLQNEMCINVYSSDESSTMINANTVGIQ